MSLHDHIHKYFKGIKDLSEIIDKKNIQKLVEELVKIKIKKGRIFF